MKNFKRNQSQKAGIGKVISKITKLLKNPYKIRRSFYISVKTAFHSKCQETQAYATTMQALGSLQSSTDKDSTDLNRIKELRQKSRKTKTHFFPENHVPTRFFS